MNQKQLHQISKILDTYGNDAQIAQTVEELLELATLLQKRRRKSRQTESLDIKICSELADVRIMIEQMLQIFNVPTVEWNIEYKLNREMERIHQLHHEKKN